MDHGRLEDGKSRLLDPIYESLATASESRVIAEQAVGRSTSEQAPLSGSPLRGQQQPGQSSAGRRRKYWPEDELCSPLTRQQRQAASKGLSLPAGRATTSLFDKSLSLGGYYHQPGDSQPGKLGYLKSSGRRLLQRLSSVRRSLRPKPDLPPPLPPDPSDEDRVFFRGFSAVSKGTYGVHSTDLVTSNAIETAHLQSCHIFATQVSTARQHHLVNGGCEARDPDGTTPHSLDAASASTTQSG